MGLAFFSSKGVAASRVARRSLFVARLSPYRWLWLVVIAAIKATELDTLASLPLVRYAI